MTKKAIEKYYCSKHGEEGTIECEECISKLQMLIADHNGHIVTDVKELQSLSDKPIKIIDYQTGEEIKQEDE